MMNERDEYGDFKPYWDTNLKCNYWVMGYFSKNVNDINLIATEMSKELNVPFDSIYFEEISRSSRYKGFKFFVCKHKNQKPFTDADYCENVYAHLTWCIGD